MQDYWDRLSDLSVKVVMVKSNLIDIDTRLTKEYSTLRKLNYNVALLCWNREKKKDLSDDYSQIKPLNLRAPYGIRSIFFLPIWELYVLVKLLVENYDIIHVINFDSFIPSLVAAKIKGKPIIYEIEDTYEDQIPLPTQLRELILRIDKYLLKFADAIILVDDCQIQEFHGLPNLNVHVIYDSPPDASHTFSDRSPRGEIFKIFYPGVLFRARKLNIDAVIEFVMKTDNVQLTISGYGDMVDQIKQLAERMPDKIKYVGWIPDRETLFQIMHNSDTTFVLKDSSVPLNKYICGSKIFEAMMCSVPIIVNANTSVAMKVKKHNCGVAVDARNQSEVESALLKLIGDRQYCHCLGENGRRAYMELYHWDIMESKLFSLYRGLKHDH
jgi:glycosyltransferase involved in cell wall biosynthesis